MECFSILEGDGVVAFSLIKVRTEPILQKQARRRSEERTASLEKVGEPTFLCTLRQKKNA